MASTYFKLHVFKLYLLSFCLKKVKKLNKTKLHHQQRVSMCIHPKPFGAGCSVWPSTFFSLERPNQIITVNLA